MDAFLQTFRNSNFFDRFVAASLRLPGVVIFELWCRIFWTKNDSATLQEQLHDKVQTWMDNFELSQFIKSRKMDVVMEQVLTYSILAFGATFLLLPAKKLIPVYLHAISILLIGAGYYLSYRYVQTEQESGVTEVMLDDFAKLERHGFHFLSQVMLAVVVSCLLNLRGGLMRASLTVFSFPIVARICGVPAEKLHVVHNFSSCFFMILICFYALNVVPDILSMLRRFDARMKVSTQEIGFVRTLYDLWTRLELPALLALFWMVLCMTEIYVTYKGGTHHSIFLEENSYRHNGSTTWYIQTLLVFANCCQTPLSLLAFSSAIAFFSWLSLFATKILLKSDGDDANGVSLEAFSRGHAEAFTLLLLAVQTELIDRPPLERALLILIILFIVFSSLLQSIFDLVEPVLLRISAAHLSDVWRHVKALSICAGLLIVPMLMSASIAALLPVDFWLMIIISSCVLTSVQTLGAVAIYCLFFFDGLGRGAPWERLDDYVFVCRAITRVLEFMVAVSVIGFGVYESIFGEWSWINSSILLVHCYFNVWQRLQAGWRTFLLRREAAKKLDMLPKARRTQLNALQDVCAICYQEMDEARMTPCNHFFHGSCLKKWLYVQQSCPMCQWDLSFKKTTSNNETTPGNAEEEGYSSDEYELAEGELAN